MASLFQVRYRLLPGKRGGVTIAQVSEKTGVHRQTVIPHLGHQGVQTRPRGLPAEYVAEAAQMY